MFAMTSWFWLERPALSLRRWIAPRVQVPERLPAEA
jgi:hypothetical protein